MQKPTVRDILKLKVMEGYRVAAGMSGLLNEIHYVNVYDNLPTELDAHIPVFPGDIYLSTLYYGKNDDAFILEFVKSLIGFKASALIVPDENLRALPAEVVSLCDKAKFPVIFIDRKTPYSVLISEIMRYQLSFERMQTIEDKLYALVDARTSSSDKKEIIMQLNPNFREHAVCLFCQRINPVTSEPLLILEDNVKIINTINQYLYDFATEYKKGLLIILTFGSTENPGVSRHISDTIEAVKSDGSAFSIGISRMHDTEELGLAVTEARDANIAGTFGKKEIAGFHDIGVSRILTELDNSKSIEDFYLDMVSPVWEYDKANGADLFATMLTFAEHDMNYRNTAKALFVHENTVRYRIEKIKELIPYGVTEMDFYLALFLAVRIHRLKNL